MSQYNYWMEWPFFKDLHLNVSVTDKRVELLGCVFDNNVVVVVAHSVWTRNASREDVTLSFSLFFSHFSLTVVLSFSLSLSFPLYRGIGVSFFLSSILFLDSFNTADCRSKSRVHSIIHTFSLRPSICVLHSFLSRKAKNSCLSCSMIGCILTASSDVEKDEEEKKYRTQENFLTHFFIRLPHACRLLLEGILCTIMMWNRHKRSLGIVIDCMCYTGWIKAPGYRSHMFHKVFIIREKNKKKNELFCLELVDYIL